MDDNQREDELISEFNNNEIARELLQNFLLSVMFKIINDFFENNYSDPNSVKLERVEEWQQEIASRFDKQWRKGIYIDRDIMKESLSDDTIAEIEGNIVESLMKGLDVATKYIKYRLDLEY